MRSAITWLLAVVLAAAGCSSIKNLPGISLSGETEQERRISGLMRFHSDRVEIYKGFETVFTARVLFLSPEIRKQVGEWEAKTKLLDPEEKGKFFEDVVSPKENQIEFLLGFYTPDDTSKTLEQAGAEWRVKLILPNGEILAASCFGVGSGEEDIYMHFLRWDLSWSKLYRICFPRSLGWADPEGDGVTLIISGPRGRGEMRIKTQPPLEY